VLEAAPAVEENPAFSVRVKVETSEGSRTLAGALFGKREPRLVEIGGIRIEAALQGHLLIFWAHDRPGLVGSIASLLAAHAIGILQMRSAAEAGAAGALAVFHVDRAVGDEVLSELGRLPSLVRVARATV
jgi:D-3-phosphoglycerate dehydrogenase